MHCMLTGNRCADLWCARKTRVCWTDVPVCWTDILVCCIIYDHISHII